MKPIQSVSYLPGQADLPGTERNETEWMAGLAARPLKPTKEQKPCDIGLFSDDANQTDLIEMLMDPLDE